MDAFICLKCSCNKHSLSLHYVWSSWGYATFLLHSKVILIILCIVLQLNLNLMFLKYLVIVMLCNIFINISWFDL